MVSDHYNVSHTTTGYHLVANESFSSKEIFDFKVKFEKN